MNQNSCRSLLQISLHLSRTAIASKTFGQRTMATSAQKKEFLCIMPDTPNALSIRKKVKPIHYEGIKPMISSGVLRAGGAICEKHPEEGEDVSFKGSVVVYAAENAEEVRKLIESDIYATSGVWDLEKVQIHPYIPAVRQPLN